MKSKCPHCKKEFVVFLAPPREVTGKSGKSPTYDYVYIRLMYEKYYSIRQTAQILKVSIETVRKALRETKPAESESVTGS